MRFYNKAFNFNYILNLSFSQNTLKLYIYGTFKFKILKFKLKNILANQIKTHLSFS